MLDGFVPSGIGLILVLHLAVRCYLIARYRWVGNDTYYHFILGELLRARGFRGLINDRFLKPERVDYPPLVPAVVASTPAGDIRSLQYLGPVADTVTLAIVAYAGASWFGPVPSLVAAWIYTTTPHSFDNAYSFGPRPLANLFLALCLLNLGWDGGPHIANVALAGVAAALVLLTHRLTAQTLLLCLITYGIWRGPASALECGIVGLVLAVVMSKAYYITSLRGHLSFLIDLARLQKSGPIRIQEMLRSVAGRTVRLVRGNPYVVLVPLIGASAERNTVSGLLEAWVVAVGVLSMVWPLGEGERHFASAGAIVALLISAVAFDSPFGWLVLPTSLAGLAFIGAKLALYPRLADRGVATIVSPSLLNACAELRRLSALSYPLVLTWPQSLSYQVMFFATARVVLGSGGTGSGLVYNVRLRQRLEADGLAALQEHEVPDFLLLLDGCPFQLDDATWLLTIRTGPVSVYAHRSGSGRPPSPLRTTQSAALVRS